MKVFFLSNKVSWFGKYSGYECINNYFRNKDNYSVYISNNYFINKIIGKIYQKINKWNNVTPAEIQAGIKFIKRAKQSDIAHILYLENHIHLLKNSKTVENNLVGTIHLPFSQWNETRLNLLKKMGNVIILYKEEIEKFSKYIDINKIHFIQHGVDINFFKPNSTVKVNKNKILFVGHYLRNFTMFLGVYTALNKEMYNEFEFHIIIPSFFRDKIPVIQIISEYKNIFFHENLSDEELLKEYQSSYLLLMPMEDSGANTAIVQAIAAGLPVITTDVGGIRSYGGGTVYPIVNNNSTLEMIDLFKYYYNNPDYRNTISFKIREYAINNLDWHIIAKRHEILYSHLNNYI